MKNLIQTIFILFITVSVAWSQSKMTSFKMDKHAFNFENAGFKVDDHFADIFNWSGLCGGMIYTAGDYFYKKKGVPDQDYTPSPGTALYNHLWSRQSKAHENIAGQIIEFEFNIGGSRNDQFWRWGVNEKLRQVVANINKDLPTPIILLRESNEILTDIADNHWVMAVGYDLGRYTYKSDQDPYFTDIRIIVYDPNEKDNYRALRPVKKNGRLLFEFGDYDISTKKFTYKADWDCITYHPNTNYYKEVSNPPSIRKWPLSRDKKVFQIVARCVTGDDDLRGGNDNVNFKITYADGTSQTCENMNLSQRLRGGSVANFELPLKRAVPLTTIKNIEMYTNAGGGAFGDNWNVQSLCFTAYRMNRTKQKIGCMEGKYRFTGLKRKVSVFNELYQPNEPLALAKKIVSVNCQQFDSPIHNNDCRKIQGHVKVRCFNSATGKEYKSIGSNKLVSFPGSKNRDFKVVNFDRTYAHSEIRFSIDEQVYNSNKYYFKLEVEDLKRCHKSCDLCGGYHCNIRYKYPNKIYANNFSNNKKTIVIKGSNSPANEHHDITIKLIKY